MPGCLACACALMMVDACLAASKGTRHCDSFIHTAYPTQPPRLLAALVCLCCWRCLHACLKPTHSFCAVCTPPSGACVSVCVPGPPRAAQPTHTAASACAHTALTGSSIHPCSECEGPTVPACCPCHTHCGAPFLAIRMHALLALLQHHHHHYGVRRACCGSRVASCGTLTCLQARACIAAIAAHAGRLGVCMHACMHGWRHTCAALHQLGGVY